jgi:hypothetical protein
MMTCRQITGIHYGIANQFGNADANDDENLPRISNDSHLSQMN